MTTKYITGGHNLAVPGITSTARALRRGCLMRRYCNNAHLYAMILLHVQRFARPYLSQSAQVVVSMAVAKKSALLIVGDMSCALQLEV